MSKKPGIRERRRKAVFQWACNQRAAYLASMLMSILSSNQIKEICDGEDLKP